MELVNLQIGGILLIPVIVGLIELFKAIGMPKNYAPWANASLTVGGYLLVMLIQAYPTYEQPVIVGLSMIVVFLGAAGFYDVAKRSL